MLRIPRKSWGGQSCPQPPFRRLFRATERTSVLGKAGRKPAESQGWLPPIGCRRSVARKLSGIGLPTRPASGARQFAPTRNVSAAGGVPASDHLSHIESRSLSQAPPSVLHSPPAADSRQPCRCARLTRRPPRFRSSLPACRRFAPGMPAVLGLRIGRNPGGTDGAAHTRVARPF